MGKSTLVNLIVDPEKKQATGAISEKYQRGRHTTNHSLYLERDDIRIIDTPGVRELLVPYEERSVLASSFVEFDCAVVRAVEEGLVDSDRYVSYLGMLESLESRRPSYMRTRFRKNKQ